MVTALEAVGASLPDAAPPALVLGYGTIDEPSIRAGFETLASVYDEHRANGLG